jgi:hypothetical protein
LVNAGQTEMAPSLLASKIQPFPSVLVSRNLRRLPETQPAHLEML